MRKPIRRRALLAGAALALPLPALGQPGFPTRSVRVIVAYGAGGTAHTHSPARRRGVAQRGRGGGNLPARQFGK